MRLLGKKERDRLARHAPPEPTMPALLDRQTLFVREHVGLFKASNAYDLVDPQAQAVVGRAQQELRGFFSKLLRFTDLKTRLPFTIHFHDAAAGDAVVLSVHQ